MVCMGKQIRNTWIMAEVIVEPAFTVIVVVVVVVAITPVVAVGVVRRVVVSIVAGARVQFRG